MTLNERIKFYRKKIGITQKELADILSVSDKTVSRWESCKQVPDALLLPDIAKALHITINDLYGLGEQNEPNSVDEPTITENDLPLGKEIVDNRAVIKYKLGIIIGLVISFISTFLLINADDVPGTDTGRLIEKIILFLGCGIILISEIVYVASYRNETLKNRYLLYDIRYSGIAGVLLGIVFIAILPIAMGMHTNYFYELCIMLFTGLILGWMIYQKSLLSKTGIKTTKVISVISVIAYAFIAIIMALIFWIFKSFDFTPSFQMMTGFYIHTYYVDTYGVGRLEAIVRFYSYICLSVQIVLLLLLNYAELLIKSGALRNMTIGNT